MTRLQKVNLDILLGQTSLSERAREYCQKRGVVFIGEIYQLPFDRDSQNRTELERFIRANHLPPLVRGITLDWHPSYLNDAAIRNLWDKPVGDLFLDSPQEPYAEQEHMTRSKYRWITAHRHGYHYVGQAILNAQRSMSGLEDLQAVFHRRRWPLHSAMLVRNWNSPEGIPAEWQEYLEKVGLPEPYRSPSYLSPLPPILPSDDDQRRYGKLAILFGSVEELALGVRVSNVMRALELTTMWDLVQYPVKELMKARHFGQKSLDELREALEFYGLSLEMSERDLVRYISNILRTNKEESR